MWLPGYANRISTLGSPDYMIPEQADMASEDNATNSCFS